MLRTETSLRRGHPWCGKWFPNAFWDPSQFAAQLLQRRRPLSLVARLSRLEVDSERTELGRARRLGRAGIDVATPGDLEVDEPRCDDSCLELCVQQSAGDSTLPEINVLLAFLRYCFLNQDVADLEAALRFEDTRHFPESSELVREEVKHAVRDDDIGPTVGHGQ